MLSEIMIACHTENLSAQILQLNLTFKYLFHQGSPNEVSKLQDISITYSVHAYRQDDTNRHTCHTKIMTCMKLYQSSKSLFQT